MELKLKTLKFFFIALVAMMSLSSSIISAKVVKADSLNLLAEFSLFNEYHKNKDFKSSEAHGWNVIHTKPQDFIKYKLFKKMEDVLWYLHDSLATTDEEKMKLTDTTLYFYDIAIQNEPDKKGTYLVRKAFILEMWKKAPVDVTIKAYEDAFAADANIDTYYKDRLGIIYSTNADETNGYKDKALDLYLGLQEADPNNEIWISRVTALAEDENQLMDFKKKSWDLNKDSIEKAWTYANTCLRFKSYERAVEPLEFLVKKAPDVVNYMKELARCYDKLEEREKALEAYKTLIKLDPENKDNYVNLAIIYKDMDQLSTSRNYLKQASKIDPSWDYPIFIEAQLYEHAVRNCGSFEFMDRCVYQYAVSTYQRCRSLGGQFASRASDRISALASTVPQKEDYFFRKLSSGTTIKIEGGCYNWIGGSIVVP